MEPRVVNAGCSAERIAAITQRRGRLLVLSPSTTGSPLQIFLQVFAQCCGEDECLHLPCFYAIFRVFVVFWDVHPILGFYGFVSS